MKEMNVSSVDKDNQLSRLRQEICQYQHEKEDLERKLIVEEAKVECVYEKKMVEETKVEKSSKEINTLMEELRNINTAKNLLLCQVQGLQKGLAEYRKTVELKEKENFKYKEQIYSLNDIVDELNSQLTDKIKELHTSTTYYKKLFEYQNNINEEVLKGLHRLAKYSTKPKCFTSRKYVEKNELLNELKERVSMLLMSC